jgi:indolepyruvate ferredoxin oxidoreductase beta subunit
MTNIMMCGVGGQGLVLTSGIVSEVARRAGFDVKSNDVIGLSQRGGRVWANIRIGDKVYSPNIPVGEADYLLALEPLEGYRYLTMLKDSGVVMMNKRIIYPADVVFEKAEYPEEDIDKMLADFESYAVDATDKGKELGNKMVANTIILGMLAGKMSIDKKIWEDVILERVPAKAKEINQEAFDYGFEYVR